MKYFSKILAITVIFIIGFTMMSQLSFASDSGELGEHEEETKENSDEEDKSVGLTNPLGSENTTVMDILSTIIDGLRDVIAPPIVAIVILYGGFLMLFSGGSPEKFNQGKKAIGYAIAGYVIILIASGITLLIESILGA